MSNTLVFPKTQPSLLLYTRKWTQLSFVKFLGSKHSTPVTLVPGKWYLIESIDTFVVGPGIMACKRASGGAWERHSNNVCSKYGDGLRDRQKTIVKRTYRQEKV